MDLNAPLGMTPPPSRKRRRIVLFIGALGGACILAGVVLVLVRADPRGGRPYAVASLPPAPPSPAPRSPVPRSPTLDTAPTGTIAPGTIPPPSAVRAGAVPSHAGSMEGGVMVYRGTGGDDGASTAAAHKPLVIDVTRVFDAPQGQGRPSAGSGSVGTTASPPSPPRVAIFVSGMGLDAGATRTATDTMPAAVSLAFLPYGDKVAAAVAAARGKGHEVLLQLPMRNESGGTPGPHALRPGASSDSVKGDLNWIMGQFGGYDGVVNLLGAPVTADSGVMTAILKAVGSRHLFYLDDGTSRRSVATILAADMNVEAAKADLVLDATSDPTVVRANLDQLVALAKRKGHAIGMASGVPEHIGAIARFASELGSKGVTLVPVATLVHGDAQGTPGAAAER